MIRMGNKGSDGSPGRFSKKMDRLSSKYSKTSIPGKKISSKNKDLDSSSAGDIVGEFVFNIRDKFHSRNAKNGRAKKKKFVLAPICIIIIALVSIAALIFSNPALFDSSKDNITKSSINREALPKGMVVETDYYSDNLGWINNKTKLLSGMREFYNKTGVQPFLYLTSSIEGKDNPSSEDLNSFADKLYNEKFKDEAHLLVVFYQKNINGYQVCYVSGSQAKSVIDVEAADILLDYIDRYYYYKDLSNEESFSKAFSDAANRIMTITKSPWIDTTIIISIIISSSVIIIVAYYFWKRKKEKESQKALETEKILSTPMEKLVQDEAELRSRKYDD